MQLYYNHDSKYLSSCLCILVFVMLLTGVGDVKGQTYYPDVPAAGDRPANMKSFDAGSLVIDMGDRQIESTTVSGWVVSGLFNLYAYSYAFRLLHAGIPLFWAIKSNKAKDGIDFSALSRRIHPSSGSYSAWGSTSLANNTFRGGPLIIRQVDAQRALNTLAWMKGNQTGLGRANSIVLYQLANATSIDIRHTLINKPHVLISKISGDEGDWGHQTHLMEAVGFILGPLSSGGHYEVVTQSEAIQAIDADTCYTMFSEPHVIYQNSTAACPRCISSVPLYKDALTQFVQSGGNMLAQCAGIPSYENSNWGSQYYPESAEGAFLSRKGVRALGNSGNEFGGLSRDTLVVPQTSADLPVTQFIGSMSGIEPGTVSEFYLFGTNDTVDFKNYGHSLVENSRVGANWATAPNLEGTGSACSGNSPFTVRPSWCPANNSMILPAGKKAYVATAAKISTTTTGGMVYYLASHSWWYGYNNGASTTTNSLQVETAAQYNGRRAFFNALLTWRWCPRWCAARRHACGRRS